MAGNKLVGYSSETRTIDQREMARLRPAKKNAPRPRAKPILREVTSGIVCFCEERFGEHQALEFMLHLRAEIGADLAKLERQRTTKRRWANAHPEKHQKSSREWRLRNIARGLADPTLIPHGTSQGYDAWKCRCDDCREARRQRDDSPEIRAKKADQQRERRARKRKELEDARQAPSGDAAAR